MKFPFSLSIHNYDSLLETVWNIIVSIMLQFTIRYS